MGAAAVGMSVLSYSWRGGGGAVQTRDALRKTSRRLGRSRRRHRSRIRRTDVKDQRKWLKLHCTAGAEASESESESGWRACFAAAETSRSAAGSGGSVGARVVAPLPMAGENKVNGGRGKGGLAARRREHLPTPPVVAAPVPQPALPVARSGVRREVAGVPRPELRSTTNERRQGGDATVLGRDDERRLVEVVAALEQLASPAPPVRALRRLRGLVHVVACRHHGLRAVKYSRGGRRAGRGGAGGGHGILHLRRRDCLDDLWHVHSGGEEQEVLRTRPDNHGGRAGSKGGGVGGSGGGGWGVQGADEGRHGEVAGREGEEKGDRFGQGGRVPAELANARQDVVDEDLEAREESGVDGGEVVEEQAEERVVLHVV
mmetsp:Transcript_1025/g.1941  ORF Transcript_1025/g.1941 Transcript_1025/m.1941 type:complete len:374 (-) Transcript_1025:867-1988(-)